MELAIIQLLCIIAFCEVIRLGFTIYSKVKSHKRREFKE